MLVDNEWLQRHLNQPTRRGMKRHSPIIKTVSGTILSVQASASHYCTPRENVGPYVSVEVKPTGLNHPENRALFGGMRHDGPCFGWVPVQTIIDVINREGGI